MIKWLKYSGVSIILALNPLWWRWLPWARREMSNEWPMGPNERTWAVGWLGLTLRVWIDNGEW